MANDLDEALADLAALNFAHAAFLPAPDRFREAVMAAVRADRAERPALAAAAALRRPPSPLNQIRRIREEQIAAPVLRRVAAAHGLTVAILKGKRKDHGAVVAKDMAKWELLAAGLSAREAGRVLQCRDFLVSRGARRYEQRTRAAGRVLRQTTNRPRPALKAVSLQEVQ